jgi:hypothetical protein
MAAFPQPAKNCGMLQQLSTKPPKQTWLWLAPYFAIGVFALAILCNSVCIFQPDIL